MGNYFLMLSSPLLSFISYTLLAFGAFVKLLNRLIGTTEPENCSEFICRWLKLPVTDLGDMEKLPRFASRLNSFAARPELDWTGKNWTIRGRKSDAG